MNRRLARIIPGLALAAAVLIAGAAQANDLNHFKTADGLLVYYGIVPAELLRSFSEGSFEATTHARIPRGKNVRHLVVAVFESDTMKRVTDAKVTARVRENGLGWTTLTLPPTPFDGATTYCGYVTIYDHRNYTIGIDVQRPDAPDIVTAEFRYSNN